MPAPKPERDLRDPEQRAAQQARTNRLAASLAADKFGQDVERFTAGEPFGHLPPVLQNLLKQAVVEIGKYRQDVTKR
ncbi:MAG: hypothetical protein ACOZNI_12995 [Myxococcota bacterium]